MALYALPSNPLEALAPHADVRLADDLPKLGEGEPVVKFANAVRVALQASS